MTEATPTGAAPAADSAAAATAAAAAPAESTASPAAQDSTTAAQSGTHESSPSLLSEATGKETPSGQPAPAAEPKTDAKAADAPKSETAKEQPAKPDDPGKTEVKADAATDPATKDATATEPPALVSIEDLKLPEGAKLDAEAGKAFVDIINDAKLSAKDRSQGLFDLHQKEITRVADAMAQHQRKVWDDTNAGWKEQTRKEFGNRLDTALGTGKAVIEEFGGDRVSRILQFLDYTGAGNHPDVIWLFDNIGKKLGIFENNIVGANPKVPAAKSPGNRGWYDKSLNAPGT